MPVWVAAVLIWAVGLPIVVAGLLGAWFRFERWQHERRRPQGRVLEFRPARAVPPGRRRGRGW